MCHVSFCSLYHIYQLSNIQHSIFWAVLYIFGEPTLMSQTKAGKYSELAFLAHDIYQPLQLLSLKNENNIHNLIISSTTLSSEKLTCAAVRFYPNQVAYLKQSRQKASISQQVSLCQLLRPKFLLMNYRNLISVKYSFITFGITRPTTSIFIFYLFIFYLLVTY